MIAVPDSNLAIGLGISAFGVVETVLLLKHQGTIPAIKPVLDLMQARPYYIDPPVYAQALEMAGEWHWPPATLIAPPSAGGSVFAWVRDAVGAADPPSRQVHCVNDIPQDCAGAVARSPASLASGRNQSTEQRSPGRRKGSAVAGGSGYEKSRMP